MSGRARRNHARAGPRPKSVAVDEADLHGREVEALLRAVAAGNGSRRPARGARGRRSGVGRARELDLARGAGARARARTTTLAAGAELGLGQLEAAARLGRARRDRQRGERDRPEEVEGQPRDEVALLLHGLGDQRRRRAAVQLARVPRPARVAGRHERVALAMEDRLGQRSSRRTTSFSPDHVSSIAATLVSTSPVGSSDLAHDVLGHVGRHLGRLLGPADPHHPVGRDGLAQARRAPLEVAPARDEAQDEVRVAAQRALDGHAVELAEQLVELRRARRGRRPSYRA